MIEAKNDGDKMLDNEVKPLEWPNLFFEEEIVNPPDLPDQFTVLPEKSVGELLAELSQRYEKVAMRLILCEGTPEFEMEMNKLLIDDRHGRQGFPPEVMAILLKLSVAHTKEFGNLLNPDDVWIDAHKR